MWHLCIRQRRPSALQGRQTSFQVEAPEVHHGAMGASGLGCHGQIQWAKKEWMVHDGTSYQKKTIVSSRIYLKEHMEVQENIIFDHEQMLQSERVIRHHLSTLYFNSVMFKHGQKSEGFHCWTTMKIKWCLNFEPEVGKDFNHSKGRVRFFPLSHSGWLLQSSAKEVVRTC